MKNFLSLLLFVCIATSTSYAEKTDKPQPTESLADKIVKLVEPSIIGNHDAVRMFANEIAKAHKDFLFFGPDNVGKTSLAYVVGSTLGYKTYTFDFNYENLASDPNIILSQLYAIEQEKAKGSKKQPAWIIFKNIEHADQSVQEALFQVLSVKQLHVAEEDKSDSSGKEPKKNKMTTLDLSDNYFSVTTTIGKHLFNNKVGFKTEQMAQEESKFLLEQYSPEAIENALKTQSIYGSRIYLPLLNIFKIRIPVNRPTEAEYTYHIKASMEFLLEEESKLLNVKFKFKNLDEYVKHIVATTYREHKTTLHDANLTVSRSYLQSLLSTLLQNINVDQIKDVSSVELVWTPPQTTQTSATRIGFLKATNQDATNPQGKFACNFILKGKNPKN